MNRRDFLRSAAAVPTLPIALAQTPATTLKGVEPNPVAGRVRPGDPKWPSASSWERLNREVGGRLAKVESPLAACRTDPNGAACTEVFRRLKNPYYIGDEPGLTQTLGWADAWTSAPSVYAVAATKTEDIVAAVNFARTNNLRLVIKGGGHSYQGTSNAPDSLLIWTRAMNRVTVLDAFVGQGCAGSQAPQAAVTVEAGAVWMQAYQAVTTRAGRYVQGGGCTTVGVAGLIQSGGFGNFSKNYGLAAAGLIEAEIVTADGAVRIANACTNPDLFWGIKGGGGGSLGVVSKVTLRTRELPEYLGAVFGKIKARTASAFRELTAQILKFYGERLFNRHWGEQIVFERGNAIRLSMVFQGLNRAQAEKVWQPFLDWVAASPEDFSFVAPMVILDIPARRFWDVAYMKENHAAFVSSDDRRGAPAENVFWEGDGEQAGQFLHGYRSAWLPDSLLKTDQQQKLVAALVAATRHRGVSLHFNKGLAGSGAEELAAARDTAMNPAVLGAFALAILGSAGPSSFPGVAGHEPDLPTARKNSAQVDEAMEELLKVAPEAGSYVSESDFFERSWQRSFWGSNYPRLAAVKKKYDPDGLFFVHHGVGSEEWSADGFTKSPRR